MAGMKSFALRLDEELFEEITALAEKEQRSINGQIHHMLRTYFDEELLAERLNQLAFRSKKSP
jgi:hypothetical protein